MTSALALRSEVVATLIARLQARPELANVTVSPFWPGDEAGDQSLYVDEISGELTIPTMKDGTLDVDDEWTITFQSRVVSTDVVEAWSRVAEIVGEVELVCREDTTLGQTDQSFAAVPRSSRSTGTEVKGGGATAFAEIVVDCMTWIREE